MFADVSVRVGRGAPQVRRVAKSGVGLYRRRPLVGISRATINGLTQMSLSKMLLTGGVSIEGWAFSSK